MGGMLTLASSEAEAIDAPAGDDSIRLNAFFDFGR
jgi:hypothetical protein